MTFSIIPFCLMLTLSPIAHADGPKDQSAQAKESFRFLSQSQNAGFRTFNANFLEYLLFYKTIERTAPTESAEVKAAKNALASQEQNLRNHGIDPAKVPAVSNATIPWTAKYNSQSPQLTGRQQVELANSPGLTYYDPNDRDFVRLNPNEAAMEAYRSAKNRLLLAEANNFASRTAYAIEFANARDLTKLLSMEHVYSKRNYTGFLTDLVESMSVELIPGTTTPVDYRPMQFAHTILPKVVKVLPESISVPLLKSLYYASFKKGNVEVAVASITALSKTKDSTAAAKAFREISVYTLSSKFPDPLYENRNYRPELFEVAINGLEGRDFQAVWAKQYSKELKAEIGYRRPSDRILQNLGQQLAVFTNADPIVRNGFLMELLPWFFDDVKESLLIYDHTYYESLSARAFVVMYANWKRDTGANIHAKDYLATKLASLTPCNWNSIGDRMSFDEFHELIWK